MVPKGWTLTTLGKLCDGQLQTGPFGSQLHADEYVESGVSVLMPKDLVGYRANTNGAAKITAARATDLKKHKLEIGDILFSRRGDVSRFALVDEDSVGAICGTGCLKAKPSKTSEPFFISFFLQLSSVKRWLEQSAVGQTMPNLNTAILAELPLMAPECKAEQRKIAKILCAWDEAIATTEQLLSNSEQQKKALMQQLLTGKKRLPGFGKPAIGGFGRQNLPQGWVYVPISKVATEVSERNTEQADLPVLSCSKYDGFIDSLKYFKKQVFSDDTSNYKVIHRGQFGFPANHVEEGSIGLQEIYEKGIVSPIYVVFSVDESKVDNFFLYKVLKTDHYRQVFAAATSASVDRRGSLRWKPFSSIKISLPRLEEQQAISQIIRSAEREAQLLALELRQLKKEKKALMQQLLTGKRRVKIEEEAEATTA